MIEETHYSAEIVDTEFGRSLVISMRCADCYAGMVISIPPPSYDLDAFIVLAADRFLAALGRAQAGASLR